MTENTTNCEKQTRTITFWVSLVSALLATAAALILAGPKLGLWSTPPGCGPQSGCDFVTNGPLGNIPFGSFMWPVSFVGIAWFTTISIVWIKTRGENTSLLWAIRLGMLGSIGFAIAMLVGGHFCKWCAAVHCFNVVVWVSAELRLRSSKNINTSCVGKSFFIWFGCTTVILLGGYLVASGQKAAASEDNLQKILAGNENSPTLKLLEADHRFGALDAPVQIVMFTDYQCPDCKRLETQLMRIFEQRDDVSISVKHFPLNFECNDEIGTLKMHGNACWAARAAETAFLLGGQDGWEKMHTWLFENRGSFTDETFSQDLTMLGFDPQQFIQTMLSQQTLQKVKDDAVDGKALGIWFTPMIFINGVEYLWYYGGQDSLARVIDTVATNSSSKVAPPSAIEKLVEDWRVGKTHTFAEENRYSPLGDGAVEIVVWGDYQTESTQKLDAIVKSVLKENSNASYVYRHFPIDSECNTGVENFKTTYPGSCNMAKVVESVDILCGKEARWNVHTTFMTLTNVVSLQALAEIASEMCDQPASTIATVANGGDVAAILNDDIRSKVRVWRRSVPVLLIDGRFVPRWELAGTTGKETLRKIVDEASQ